MYRYVAMAWDARNAASASMAASMAGRLRLANTGWTVAIEGRGMLLCHTGGTPEGLHAYVLRNSRGVVVGKLFHRRLDEEDIPNVVALNETETRTIVATQGRHLIENYWGSYVALLSCGTGEEHHVVRDPTGAMPCFRMRTAGVSLFFSHIEDCLEIAKGVKARRG